MDSIKSLMDKREYELVIKITDNSIEPNDLFYRISAFLALGKLEEGIKTINLNKKFLRTNLALLIKTHIELLCIAGHFDEAYEELDAYKNLPYESQQVEEELAYYSKYIREEEKKAVKGPNNLSEDEIIRKLNSEDSATVMVALGEIMHQNIAPYQQYLFKLIKTYRMKTVRTFALFILMANKLDKDVELLNNGTITLVNPSKLIAPFEENAFVELVRKIETNFKNPSLSNAAIKIYSSYVMYLFPDRCEYEDKYVICALYGLAAKLFNDTSIDLEKKCLDEDADYEKVVAIMDEIEKTSESF